MNNSFVRVIYSTNGMRNKFLLIFWKVVCPAWKIENER